MKRVRAVVMTSALIAPIAGAWALAATPALAAPLKAPAAHAKPAKAPAPKSAWFSSTNVAHGLPALPTVGVTGSQLFVEGSNALPNISLLGDGPASAQAVTAVSWKLPKHTAATNVTFKIAGTAPAAVSVQACKLTGSFKAGSDQAFSSIPSYSCAKVVNGTLSGSQVSFKGIGALVTGRKLSVLILPGPLDRLVLSAPTRQSLVLTKLAAAVTHVHHTAGTTPPTAKSAAQHHAVAASSSTSVNSDPATSLSAPSGRGGVSSLPAGGTTPSGSGAAAAPSVASPSTVGTSTTPTTALAGATTSLIPTSGWRRWAALAVILAEVLLFVLVQRRREVTADRTMDLTAADTALEPSVEPGRGVGRFISVRDSQPMPL